MTTLATDTCATCGGRLDYAAVLCDSDRCTSCELQRMQPVVSEWATFVAALRSSARADGTVHVNDVRPRVRGRIAPKHIGSFYRRAAAEGLIRFAGWEDSTDAAGRNADKKSRYYRWLGT